MRIKFSHFLLILTTGFLFFIFFIPAFVHVSAATFIVAPGDTSGLIAAINAANDESSNPGPDTINLASESIYTLGAVNNNGYGPSGLPTITSEVTINGNGSTIQRDGLVPEFRIIAVHPSGSFYLNDIQLQGGTASSEGNPVVSEGGAIISLGDLHLNAVRFENNSTTYGGALANVAASAEITNSMFANNTAYTAGAIMNREGVLTMTGTTVEGNTATLYGGGIYNNHTVTLTNSQVIGNETIVESGAGGGLFHDGGTLNVSQSEIRDNASGRGAGLFSQSLGFVTISASTISDNTAPGNGGGIFYAPFSGNGTLSLQDSLIENNVGFDGGGVHVQNGGTITISNTKFFFNSSLSGHGGAFEFNNYEAASGSNSISNSCFFGNSDVGVYNYSASPIIDAASNWWGASDGPSGIGNGTGDSVSENVNFTPFLSAAPSGCLSLNDPPTAHAGGPYTVNEGDSVTLFGFGSDPNDDPLVFSWDLDNNGSYETLGQIVAFSAANIDGPSVKTVSLQVCDTSSECAIASASVEVTNVDPTITSITVPSSSEPVQTSVSVSATFDDPGILDTHTATWTWDDGSTSMGLVGMGTVSGAHVYSDPGVYLVSLTITDDDGGSHTSSALQYVVVFDSTAGFVTGSGNFNSPDGAYLDDPTASGKAHFGFSVKYLPGDSVPSGSNQFRFRVADLDLSGSAFQWLVITSPKVLFKGTGVLEGRAGIYTFVVSAIDDEAPGGTDSVDKYRVKITDENSVVIYDNQLGANETANPTTPLMGGSIVIH